MTLDERLFFYMPLTHAEDAELQVLSVEKFTTLRDEATQTLDYAKGYRSTVERFGRFPHRNAALGHTSTLGEEAYLASEENEFH